MERYWSPIPQKRNSTIHVIKSQTKRMLALINDLHFLHPVSVSFAPHLPLLLSSLPGSFPLPLFLTLAVPVLTKFIPEIVELVCCFLSEYCSLSTCMLNLLLHLNISHCSQLWAISIYCHVDRKGKKDSMDADDKHTNATHVAATLKGFYSNQLSV